MAGVLAVHSVVAESNSANVPFWWGLSTTVRLVDLSLRRRSATARHVTEIANWGAGVAGLLVPKLVVAA